MNVEIRTRHVSLSDALRAHCERRLVFALGRFRRRVARVALTLADLNGPRGGLDQLCRIIVDLDGGQRVVVEGLDADAYAAVDAASHRAAEAVARAVGRAREHAPTPVVRGPAPLRTA